MLKQLWVAFLYLISVSAVPYDLLNKKYVDYNWLEVGFIQVDPFSTTNYWVTVTTQSVLTGKAVVFISLPDVEDILNAGWFTGADSTAIPPIVPKIKNLPVQNIDGTYTFQFKLVSVNDTFCSRNFGYNPFFQDPPSANFKIQVSWLLAQKGAYSVKTNYTDENDNTNFIIDSGPITRASAAPQATNSNGNAIRYLYPYNCDDPSLLCTVNTNSGAIQQLQTSVNKVNGMDMFLTVRAWQIKIRNLWLVLVPHDSLDPSYFVITKNETVAYMVFPSGLRVNCAEGFAIETKTFTNVTNRPVPLSYDFVYQYPPGVYGMLGTVNSMVDATSLQIFDTTTTGSVIITKEDQCASAQIIHLTPETVHLLLFGEVAGAISTTTCSTFYTRPETHSPTATPTTKPTLAPSAVPSLTPTAAPSVSPTLAPSDVPTLTPTAAPSASPTLAPTFVPTRTPTAAPTQAPTAAPSASPTLAPTLVPTFAPSPKDSVAPTLTPSSTPTALPTTAPSASPTAFPSSFPTAYPSMAPTSSPTAFPSSFPTAYPTVSPTHSPTAFPSSSPTDYPSVSPTPSPTRTPTASPSSAPTASPTFKPSFFPTANPSAVPTGSPSRSPTRPPTSAPSFNPSVSPTASPTRSPTFNPSASPTTSPSSSPTALPTFAPTSSPSAAPSASPTASPTATPTSAPTRTCVDYTITK